MANYNIVSIGEKPARMAESFIAKNQNVIAIGTSQITDILDVSRVTYVELPVYFLPEAYDNLDISEYSNFFDNLENNKLPTVFIIDGSHVESAITLRFMEVVKNAGLPIYVLYLVPDRVFLRGINKKLERAVFAVLQEYTRSGLIEEFHSIDYAKILTEFAVENIEVESYYDNINLYISSIYDTLLLAMFEQLVVDKTYSEYHLEGAKKIDRICGIKIISYDNPEKNQTFSEVFNPTTKDFYFFFNTQEHKNSKSISRVSEIVKEYLSEDESEKYFSCKSYAMSNYPEDYNLCVCVDKSSFSFSDQSVDSKK